MDVKSAELTKYASNSFLAMKISYINEIANFCEKVGADINNVVLGMGSDERIGHEFLNAGIGYGGSCFPKDTKELYISSKKNNFKITTILAAMKVNEKQNFVLIHKARKYFDDFINVNVSILGVSFKPNTNDIRESIAVKNIEILIESGAIVKLYDPIVRFIKIKGNIIEVSNNIDETLKGSEVCFIFTEWDNILNINPIIFKKLMKRALILDGRNCYDIDEMKKLDINYISIGRN